MSNENELLAAMDAASAFVQGRLPAMKREKGLVGIWCDAFRAGWQASTRRPILSDEAVERRPAVYIGMNDVTAYVTDDMVDVVRAAFDALPRPPFGEPVLPLYLHPAPSSPVPVEARGTSLLSDERIDGLIRLWAVDHPSVEGGLYEGNYAQDIYLLLIAEKARRTVDIPTPPTGGSNG